MGYGSEGQAVSYDGKWFKRAAELRESIQSTQEQGSGRCAE